uniref:Glycosyltransferase 87 family protein n=1 Tax=Janibacter limosus TaxID=53458 RepID=A0AC61U530_9MICO|nr:glycosyltransferase 87 family protein [Janibacter limosus]
MSRVSRPHLLLGVALFVLIAARPIAKFLLLFPRDQWQVDVQVYREGGISVLQGRDIYAQMTQPPQLLPFTYPPIAAFLSVPLAFVPFPVAARGWTIAQLLANVAITRVAWFRLRERVGVWAPVLVGVVAAGFLWTQPVGDGIRFAQVNAFLVLACLLDLQRPRARWLAKVPPGVLVGPAMAIKLTPGVFVIHYLLNRRWREAGWAIGTATFVSVAAWLALPQASFAFWGGALSDPTRLGPNDGSANRAFRATLLRRGLEGTELTLAWAPWLLVMGAIVFWVAHRAHRQGDWIAEVGAVGPAGFLISPVSPGAPPALDHGHRPGDPRLVGPAGPAGLASRRRGRRGRRVVRLHDALLGGAVAPRREGSALGRRRPGRGQCRRQRGRPRAARPGRAPHRP